MNRLRYFWKFWVRPILLGIDPNSKEGLTIRIEKLEVDGERKRQ